MGKVFGKVVDHEKDIPDVLNFSSEAFYRKILPAEEKSEQIPIKIRGPSSKMCCSSSSSSSSSSPIGGSPPKRISPIVPGASHENSVMVARHKRIIKELTVLQASAHLRVGLELRDDDLSVWYVELFDVNPGTQLFQEMYYNGVDHILLELCFTKEFPYSPPSLRVVSPSLFDPTHELLKWDGVVKTDRLAPGWSSYTSVESLFVQLEVLLAQLRVEIKKGLS